MNCGFCGNRLTSDKQRRRGECAECIRAGQWLKGRRQPKRAEPRAEPRPSEPRAEER